MKPSLGTPSVTAHALGELNPAEERLLRMTFHDPAYARQLDAECTELRQISGKLSSVLKAEAGQFSLTDEQREAIFQNTAAPYPAGRKPALPEVEKQPISFQKAVAERKKFDRRPARLATYLTGAAAAAIIILLARLPSKDGQAGGSGKAQMTQITTQEQIDAHAPAFKVIQPNPEKIAKEKENKRAIAGAPQSMMDLSAKPNLPMIGQVKTQSTDSSLPTGRIAVPKPEIPSTAQVPKQAEPKGEMDITKKKKDGVYSSKKRSD